MVFAPEQRAVLIAAWQRGFLCDTQNYKPLSRITGLTRKQISNWRRSKTIKCADMPLPVKSTIPLCSAVHELAAALGVKDPLFLKVEPGKSSKKCDNPYVLLSEAWKKGYLLDSEHYGALSKITGLNRKQISGFARKRLRSDKCKPLPRKGLIPCSPSVKFFRDIMARHKNRRMELATILPKETFLVSGDLAQPPRKRKRGFTDQQRKILIVSWHWGYLSDNTHYEFLSQISGLTRKQISNWATMMHRQGQNLSPIKSTPVDNSMKKEFSDIFLNEGEDEEFVPTVKTEAEQYRRPIRPALCVKLEKDKPGFTLTPRSPVHPFIRFDNFQKTTTVLPPHVSLEQEAAPAIKLESE